MLRPVKPLVQPRQGAAIPLDEEIYSEPRLREARAARSSVVEDMFEHHFRAVGCIEHLNRPVAAGRLRGVITRQTSARRYLKLSTS